jgi:hypothetical protein
MSRTITNQATSLDIEGSEYCKSLGHKPRKFGDGIFCDNCGITMTEDELKDYRKSRRGTVGFVCNNCHTYVDVDDDPDHKTRCRPADQAGKAFVIPKFERGYPIAQLENYWPEGKPREVIRERIKQNSPDGRSRNAL